MTQEDKELIFKELCARLPYHVKCKIWLKDGTTEEGLLDLQHNYGDVLQDAFYYNKIKDIKPYLRPMSSMTEEEKEEYCQLQQKVIYNSKGVINEDVTKYINWCYKKHLDINNLIPMELAIDATGLNIY
jgi:hypothetical protein